MASAGREARLDAAERDCANHGRKLTAQRRAVFGLILDAGKPLTAYELLDRLRETHKNATPATIYRALDFLLEADLIHKVESLSAFIPCVDEGAHDHPAQFLICRNCGTVAEIEDAGISAALQKAAAKLGFQPGGSIVEVKGLCATCAAASPTA